MDNTVVTEEIGIICLLTKDLDFKTSTNCRLCACCFTELLCQGEEKDSIWNPLLLVIPLRLGLLNINPIYIDALKVFYQ